MILFITDSLGGPRFSPEQLYYQDTWVYKVRQRLSERGIETHSLVCYGLDSNELRFNLSRFTPFYRPQFVVYQIGICDCAPRAISLQELQYVNLLPDRLRYWIKAQLKKRFDRVTTLRNLCNVPLPEFTENIKYLSEQFDSLFIPIAPVCDGYTSIAPLIEQNVAKYNAVLRQYSSHWLEQYAETPRNFVDIMFTSDHHHLNRFGQNYLADCILNNTQIMDLLKAQT